MSGASTVHLLHPLEQPAPHSSLPLPQVGAESESPAGRGGAACVAIYGGRTLCYGGASRVPTGFNDWWLLELGPGGSGSWTKLSPAAKLSRKRKLLPRSGASLSYIPAPDGGSGKAYLFGGQEPRSGAFLDELLVRRGS